MAKMDIVHVFGGCMWEGSSWELVLNHECSDLDYGKPCKHCYGETIKVIPRCDGSTWEVRVWICPRLVVAYNEAGRSSTAICLDCILEAEASLRLPSETGLAGETQGSQ